MPALDVWIARPGNASRVDDGSWTVTIYDALYDVFEWAQVSYASLPAPEGHWAGNLPPGTYVVRAVSTQSQKTTDHAVVSLDHGEMKGIILFVGGERRILERPPHHGERPEERCTITIREVVGRGGRDMPRNIVVSGTAVGCPELVVEAWCPQSDRRGSVNVTVSQGGAWRAEIPNNMLACSCGERLVIVANCANDHCRDIEEVAALRCD